MKHSREEREEILKTLCVERTHDLVARVIPESLLSKPKDRFNLPSGVSELEVNRDVTQLSELNIPAGKTAFFLGGGTYRHHIPAAVGSIISRSEFLTSYTPFQSEASQGSLQADYEFAAAMCELTGMGLATQPHYDGICAAAEAIRMACRMKKGNKFLIPFNLNPITRSVFRNYTKGLDLEMLEVSWDLKTGGIDKESLERKLDSDVVGAYFELPNQFGVVDPYLMELKEKLGDAIYIVGVPQPLALALYAPPGDWGADIVTGDLQPLGNPMSLGGPRGGFITTHFNWKYSRQLPGRIVDITKETDSDREVFYLALQTREQFIRGKRATSNITTNASLNGLAALSYLSLLGRKGLRETAIKCAQNARKLASALDSIDEVRSPNFSGYFFNEFVVKLPWSRPSIFDSLRRKGVNAGLNLYNDSNNSWALVSATELTTDEDIELYRNALGQVIKGGLK